MALEDIRELTLLKLVETGLYDLFLTTNTGINVPLKVFVCERKHEMKLYQVSNDLYETIEYTGLLCTLNEIYNPFSIKENDIILWTERVYADQLLNIPPEEIVEAKREAVNNLFNVKKKPKPNKNRNLFKDRGVDALPPNVLPNSAPQIVVDNNKIKLTPNLFNNPKSNITFGEPEASGTFDDAIPPAEENLERVLVRRYVRKV